MSSRPYKLVGNSLAGRDIRHGDRTSSCSLRRQDRLQHMQEEFKITCRRRTRLADFDRLVQGRSVHHDASSASGSMDWLPLVPVSLQLLILRDEC